MNYYGKRIFGLTIAKDTHKNDKGKGVQQFIEKDVYYDLDTLEESIRENVHESEKDIVTIKDIYSDEEDTGVPSS